MFTEVFWFQVLLSFLVGGLWVGGMTLISERFGSKIGGLLVSLPSTGVVALLFIALTQNQEAMVSATTVMPSAIAAATIFLVMFAVLYRFGWVLDYFGAIAIWFALNLPLVILDIENIAVSLLLAVLIYCVSVTYFHKHPHRKLGAVKVSTKAVVLRVIFAGSFIALAVLLAKLAGPAWGGLFSSYPAAFSATVILFARKHGIEFTSSVSRTMVHGNMSIVVFAIFVFLLVPHIGVALGLIFAYLSSLIFSSFSYKYVLNRL
ncbi:MAG TPA: DUF3147 family protein [Candidatus Saccharimonadales bacterium]|nr:DUF3147 family protein [Candidatus Saccharimonadales bacterium]